MACARPTSSEIPARASATRVGLTYVADDAPGIRRVRAGHGFRYVQPDSRPVRSRQELARIRALVIPPAWSDVWISTNPNGHLQATGRDARKRKQYIYHSAWSEGQSRGKYHRLLAFGKILGKLRRRIDRDLRKQGLPKDKVVAAVVRLLDSGMFRVGNGAYAKQNGSFGLTTLRDRHVKIRGKCIRFEFKGKSGVEHAIDFHDRRLARIVKRCQDLPGQDLFQYMDDKEQKRLLRSDDVNAYLRRVCGENFTAKDFRTWAGTVMVAAALKELKKFKTTREAETNICRAITAVAKRLGNTRTVCRQAYVHPAVLDAYTTGSLARALARCSAVTQNRISADEQYVLALLSAARRNIKK